MDIQIFFTQLDKLFEQGNKDAVSPFLEAQFNQAVFEKDDASQLSILNEMIGYYRTVGLFEKCHTYSERALEKMKRLGLTSTSAYGTTLLNAATAYRASGNLGRAQELFNEALTLLESTLPPNDYRLAGLYNNASSLYQEQGDVLKAISMLDRSLSILKHHPESAIELAVTHTNKALAYFQLGQEKEGLLCLKPALEIYARTLDNPNAPTDPHYASALSGLAEGCLRMGLHSRAVELYEKALSEIEGKFGQNKDYFTVCKNCALACEALGETERAAHYRQLVEERFSKERRS